MTGFVVQGHIYSVVQVTSKLEYIIDYLLLLFKSNSLPYNITVSEL